MNKSEVLDAEVSLLLLKYGRKAVIKALAVRLDSPDELLSLELRRSLDLIKGGVQKRERKIKPFDIGSIVLEYPDKAELLTVLNGRYEDKIFLPELKDIKRLFDRHHRSMVSVRSRLSAQKDVFRLLATLDKTELKKLVNAPVLSSRESSLGIISDQILGRNTPGGRNRE